MNYFFDLIRGKEYYFTNFRKNVEDVVNSMTISGATLPQVSIYTDLPDPTLNINKIYFVQNSTSDLIFFNRKPKGFYYSNGVIWTYAGDFPTLFGDTVFRIYDSENTSREIGFSADTISDNTTRYVIMPDRDVNLNDIYNHTHVASAITDYHINSENVVYVKKNPGTNEFSSISDAANSITGASETTPYTIIVSSGLYVEPEIIVPPYVSIKGDTINTVIVEPDTQTHHVFVLNQFSELSFMTIQNAGSGYAGVYSYDAGEFTQLHKLSIYNCDYGILMSGNTIDSQLYVEYVDINGDYTNAVRVIGSSGCTTDFQAENFYTYSSSGFSGTTCYFDGENVNVEFLAFGLKGGGNGEILIEINNDINVDLSSGFLMDSENAIKVDGVVPTPSLKASSITFLNNTLDLNIINSGTTGYYDGYTQYTKNYINPLSNFFIANKDAKIIVVAKKGGDFDSVKDAIDSITDNSPDNRYVVEVNPGVFEENQIIMKPYVDILGESYFNSIIKSINPDEDLIIATGNTLIQNVFLEGATGNSKSLIVYNGGVGVSRLDSVRFGDCYTAIKLNSTNGNSVSVVQKCSIESDAFMTLAFDLQSFSSNTTSLLLESFTQSSTNSFLNFLEANGNVVVGSTNLNISKTNGLGVFANIYNGAEFRNNASTIRGFDTTIQTLNIGSAPKIYINSIIIRSSTTYDMNLEHQQTTGSVIGLMDETKLSADSNIVNLALFVTDINGKGLYLTGNLFQGLDWSTKTNITESLKHSTNIGVDEGGIMTYSGFTVNVSDGDGYVVMGVEPDDYIRQVTWTNQTIGLSANTHYYLYIDQNGVLQKSESTPNTFSNIFIGHVRTDSSGITYIQDTQREGDYVASKLDRSWRQALGSIFRTGCIVTESSTPFKIDITSGEYWFSTHQYQPSAKSGATFYSYYRDGLGGWVTESADTVLTKYDTSTGATITLTAGQFTKHTLYVVNDDVEQKNLLVYGQEIFNSAIEAEAGSLPTQPSFFVANVAPIAGIVVEGGASGITSISDIRPTLSFRAESSSVSNIHGNLLGLDADNHTQYLLVDGTRAMSGDLLLNNNDIISAGTINNVTIQSHASRHMPNGSDPLPIGTPVAIGNSLFSGISNTFAMSDHVHTVDYTNVQGLVTQLNTKYDKTGGTISGDVVVTGSTYLVATTAKTITNVDYIGFNPNYTGNTIVEGRMYWDEPNGTVSLGMHGGNVLQQIGLEYYYYIKNQSGATIQNGRVVRASGTLGSSAKLLGEYMIADGSIAAKYTLGIATEDITNGNEGYVTEFGLVRGIDTTGSLYGETWANGDILWVSPTIAGGLTKVEPQAPDLKIEIAIVVHANANGSIFVRPHRFPYLRDIQDVNISSGVTNNNVLAYNGSISAWTNTTNLNLNSITASTIFSGSTNIDNIFLQKSPIDFSFDGTYTTTSTAFGNIPITIIINSGNTYLNNSTGLTATLYCDVSQSDVGINGEFQLYNVTDATQITATTTTFTSTDGIKATNSFTLSNSDLNKTFRIRMRRTTGTGANSVAMRSAQLIIDF